MLDAEFSSKLGHSYVVDWPPIQSSYATMFGMPQSGASFDLSHSATNCLMPGHFAWIACTIGRKLMSKHSTWSSAWFAIHAICSGCRRGLIVCSTRPDPVTPKDRSKLGYA